MKKIIACICLVLIACLALPMTLPVQSVSFYTASAASSISISNPKHVMHNGETTIIRLQGTSRVPVWTSSNKKVATVSAKGRISAKSPGKANIIATLGKTKYICKLTVKPALTVSKKSLSIEVEKKATIKVTYSLNDTIWFNCEDNGDIVHVEWTDAGFKNNKTQLFVTGLKAGTTTIRIYDKKAKESYDIEVTVKKKTIKGDLKGLIGQKTSTVKKQLADPLVYCGVDDGFNVYENDYMTVYDSDGKIASVFLTKYSSKYNLFGIYPGSSWAKAKKSFAKYNPEKYEDAPSALICNVDSKAIIFLKKGKKVNMIAYGY